MENIMDSILLTINLKGRIGAPVAHKDLQVNRVDVSARDSKHPEWITNKILHTDRGELPCSRKLVIDADIVNSWVMDGYPRWETLESWKKKSPEQRVISYLDRYDEGCGYEYSFFTEE